MKIYSIILLHITYIFHLFWIKGQTLRLSLLILGQHQDSIMEDHRNLIYLSYINKASGSPIKMDEIWSAAPMSYFVLLDRDSSHIRTFQECWHEPWIVENLGDGGMPSSVQSRTTEDWPQGDQWSANKHINIPTFRTDHDFFGRKGLGTGFTLPLLYFF